MTVKTKQKSVSRMNKGRIKEFAFSTSLKWVIQKNPWCAVEGVFPSQETSPYIYSQIFKLPVGFALVYLVPFSPVEGDLS